MTAWAVGQLITMARLNDKIFGIVGYADRQSNGTATAAVEQSYLRLDNIPIVNGEMYDIKMSPMIFNSNVANDIIAVRLRANTAGIATSASTLLTELRGTAITAGGIQQTKELILPYPATVTGNLSLLLSYQRVSGTGNVNLLATSTQPIRFTVQRCGTTPTDTGVDL